MSYRSEIDAAWDAALRTSPDGVQQIVDKAVREIDMLTDWKGYLTWDVLAPLYGVTA